MDVDRLRENLAADVGRLREVAEDMTALVPTCPGWIVEDLVRHVADGYLRAVSRIGPHGSGGPQPPIARGKHSWILLDWAYASLTAKFEACERAARASGSGWPDPSRRARDGDPPGRRRTCLPGAGLPDRPGPGARWHRRGADGLLEPRFPQPGLGRCTPRPDPPAGPCGRRRSGLAGADHPGGCGCGRRRPGCPGG